MWEKLSIIFMSDCISSWITRVMIIQWHCITFASPRIYRNEERKQELIFSVRQNLFSYMLQRLHNRAKVVIIYAD